MVGNALPTMAIATTKYDENGTPKQTKWRIVALGNFDARDWYTKDCYAPVLSMLELRFLVSLAVQRKVPLNNEDSKQAFVQETLPLDEKMSSVHQQIVPEIQLTRTGDSSKQ